MRNTLLYQAHPTGVQEVIISLREQKARIVYYLTGPFFVFNIHDTKGELLIDQRPSVIARDSEGLRSVSYIDNKFKVIFSRVLP